MYWKLKYPKQKIIILLPMFPHFLFAYLLREHNFLFSHSFTTLMSSSNSHHHFPTLLIYCHLCNSKQYISDLCSLLIIDVACFRLSLPHYWAIGIVFWLISFPPIHPPLNWQSNLSKDCSDDVYVLPAHTVKFKETSMIKYTILFLASLYKLAPLFFLFSDILFLFMHSTIQQHWHSYNFSYVTFHFLTLSLFTSCPQCLECSLSLPQPPGLSGFLQILAQNLPSSIVYLSCPSPMPTNAFSLRLLSTSSAYILVHICDFFGTMTSPLEWEYLESRHCVGISLYP